MASRLLRYGESIWFSNRDREVRNGEERICKCSVWQKEKLRFLPCPLDEHYGVSKGSSSPEEPQGTLESLQTGKSRRKQMIWHIWWYFPVLEACRRGTPRELSWAHHVSFREEMFLFYIVEHPLWASYILSILNTISDTKKSEKFCTVLIQILCPSFGENPASHRPAQLSVLMLFWILG